MLACTRLPKTALVKGAATVNHRHGAAGTLWSSPRFSMNGKRNQWTTFLIQHRNLQHLSTPQLRAKFTDYFVKQNGHTSVKSASVIPHNDKSLLFTNAGMVQFKEYFRNPSTTPFKTATTVQKCLRAGGKHNDLDNVGFTPRHHTFFEMLGNFSFGDYSKPGAIAMAWKFLTEVLELPKDRLRVTVLTSDDESFEIWKQQEGVPEDRILRCGPKDNFWSMGEGPGPCGPCTEIFWDTQNLDAPEDDRWLEIWNLVFMQHYRNESGELEPLPIACVDTGMGLERLASVSQGKENNYETDAFTPIFEGLEKVMSRSGLAPVAGGAGEGVNSSPHKKIIVDHLRAMSFLIADGVIPSNVGRGYVLRRIIRRALRSGNQLGFSKPFMTELYPFLLSSFGPGVYPDLESRQESIKSVILQEEEIFMSTLAKGLAVLEPIFKQSQSYSSDKKVVPPKLAFQLYDTYGFPLDLTVLIAEEKGWTVDMDAVEELKQKQKEQGRASWKSGSSTLLKTISTVWKDQGISPKFSGYESKSLMAKTPSKVLAVQDPDDGTGDLIVSIDPCPFYGMGGGQSPDSGTITLANGHEWQVVDVFVPYEHGLAIRIQPKEMDAMMEKDIEFLRQGQSITTSVDIEKRNGLAAHHSATHLLNAALRKTLGKPIMQAGSLVESHRLRFDFTHGKPIEQQQIRDMEDWINEVSLHGIAPVIEEHPLQKALDMGSIAVFSEKYAEKVRVVDFPKLSMELCGGTHVENLEQIFPFKILSEGSVAAGTRRIEAVVGTAATQHYIAQDRMVTQLQQDLKGYGVASQSLDVKVNLVTEELARMTWKLNKVISVLAKQPLAQAGRSGILDGSLLSPTKPTASPLKVMFSVLPPDLDDGSYINKKVNLLKEEDPDVVHVLLWGENSNQIVVGLEPARFSDTNQDQPNAAKILKSIVKKVGGKGGGSHSMARGVLNTGSLPALEELLKIQQPS